MTQMEQSLQPKNLKVKPNHQQKESQDLELNDQNNDQADPDQRESLIEQQEGCQVEDQQFVNKTGNNDVINESQNNNGVNKVKAEQIRRMVERGLQ